jgi:hypothetical protein
MDILDGDEMKLYICSKLLILNEDINAYDREFFERSAATLSQSNYRYTEVTPAKNRQQQIGCTLAIFEVELPPGITQKDTIEVTFDMINGVYLHPLLNLNDGEMIKNDFAPLQHYGYSKS